MYDSRWDRERAAFLRAHPDCACGEKATVVDHIAAHRGASALFWSKSNWQPLCRSCHAAKTMREINERRVPRRA